MAVFDGTALNATTQELWDSEVDEGRYASAVWLNRIANKSAVCKSKGDKANLTYAGRYAAGDVTSSTGGFTPQQLTTTSVTVTVNQWKQIAIESVDMAEWQSLWAPESTFRRDAGAAIGEAIDTYGLALYTGLTSNVVGDETANGLTPFDIDRMLTSVLKLRDKNIPMDSLSFILPPIAFYNGVCRNPQLVDANKTGLPKSVLTTGFRLQLQGIPTYETTLCPVSANNTARIGLLLHKSAFASVVQKNMEYRTADAVAAGKISRISLIHSLFGAVTFREDHGCQIYIQKT